MAFDDLFKGLAMFDEGLKRYQVSSAIGKATEQVNQLNQQSISEQERRAGFMQLGNQLAQQLGGLGAPVSQIQSVVGSIQPQLPQTPQQAELQGTLMGQTDVAAEGARLTKEARDFELQKMREQNDMQLERLMAIQGAKQAAGAKLRLPTSGEIDKIQGFDADFTQAEELLNRVNENENLVGVAAGRNPIRSLMTEPATFDADLGRWFDSYRQRITGAGASPGEIKMLRENLPKSTDRAPVFKKKMDSLIGIGNKVKTRYLSNLQRGGRDVSEFISNTAAPGSEGGAREQVLVIKGKTYRGRMNPDGSFTGEEIK